VLSGALIPFSLSMGFGNRFYLSSEFLTGIGFGISFLSSFVKFDAVILAFTG